MQPTSGSHDRRVPWEAAPYTVPKVGRPRTLLLPVRLQPIEWYPHRGEPSHLTQPNPENPSQAHPEHVSVVTLNPIKLSLSTITTTRQLFRAKVHDGIKTWSFWLNPASCLLRFPQPLPPFLYLGHREFPCGFLIVSSNSVSYLLSTVCRMVQDMCEHSAIEHRTG